MNEHTIKRQFNINDSIKQQILSDFDFINSNDSSINNSPVNIKSILLPIGGYDLIKNHYIEAARRLSVSQNLNSNIIVIITYYRNYHYEEKIYLSNHSYYETMFGSKLMVNKNLKAKLSSTKNTKLSEYITTHERTKYLLNTFLDEGNAGIKGLIEKDIIDEYNYEDNDESLDLFISCTSLWFKNIEIFPIWISTFNEDAIAQLMFELSKIINQKYLIFCLGNVNHFSFNLTKSIQTLEEKDTELIESLRKRCLYKRYSNKLDISLAVFFAFEKTINKVEDLWKVDQIKYSNNLEQSKQQNDNDVISFISCLLHE